MINPPMNVAILDFRNVIAKGSAEVVERHERYALALKQLSNNLDSNLIILSPTERDSGEISNSSSLRFHSLNTRRWNLLGYSFKSAHYLRKTNSTSCVLVAGDPWESSIAAILTNVFLGGNNPIQIQIHADIGDPNWIKISRINSIRKSMATISLRAATLIRTTTPTQGQNLIRVFGIQPEKLVCIPVQLNPSSFGTPNSKQSHAASIGLLGRIHKDRGLEKALQTIKVVSEEFPEISVMIAGDGPDLEWFKIELQKIVKQEQTEFLGFLEREKVELFWKRCGVLLSVAPAESFGRAMREALVRGIPVLATVSAGSLELKAQTGGMGVVLIDVNDTPTDIIHKYKLAKSMSVDSGIVEEILLENAEIPLNLAKSWISMRH
jgi:glycosyltransferase involved in cell wall biosynthesis